MNFQTLAALDCFKRAEVDIALLEVGMGGRLDAINVVDPDVSVVTTVSLDHQEYLGFSIEAIAKEKSGIFRANKPAIYGDNPVPYAITDMAERLGSQLFIKNLQFTLDKHNNDWSWVGKGGLQYSNLPIPKVVISNAATAIQALQFLPTAVTIDNIRKGLSEVSVTGRFQKVVMSNHAGENIDVILDVAHNPQAATQLKHELDKLPHAGSTHVVIAICEDKEYIDVVMCVSPCVDQWYPAQFNSPRALAAEVLEQKLTDRGYSVSNKSLCVNDALTKALQKSLPGDRIVVMGSFMTVAAVLADRRYIKAK